MRYYGNLAVREERQPEQQKKPQQQRAAQTATHVRRKSIPVGEKLLYLLTVFVCVAMAGIILYRNAGLYEMNRDIQQTTSEYETSADQTKELQREVDKLRDPARIQRLATEKGYVFNNGQKPLTLSADGN
ncbi:cell division protein FtsL [Cohnella sp. JJ-181]|uniref:cell division protein FtsL n=1 Tax=Cohnella rhizoplanae TaxID=2974897 RepID=UPI0022FF9C79|nr:septum formation initiator family protein [Cohnella sp. JJ-181]CAI6020046.1 Cell division protein FtsL [Cohnella sp. JJ-181]